MLPGHNLTPLQAIQAWPRLGMGQSMVFDQGRLSHLFSLLGT